jgi:hypothetical protein
MSTDKGSTMWKWVFVVLLGIAIGVILLDNVRRARAHSSVGAIHEAMHNLDVELTRQGYVKVGDHTWRPPRYGETNMLLLNLTNVLDYGGIEPLNEGHNPAKP